MSDPLAAIQQALATASPAAATGPRRLDPTVPGRTNPKTGRNYAPDCARGFVHALGVDENGNAYFAVPAYEVIRCNPNYERDAERMQQLMLAASSQVEHDVNVRSGKEIEGKNGTFRPRYLAEIVPAGGGAALPSDEEE